ncbi:uncharacterized protein LOC135850027 isoform X1 [Planococcus citri]|uniref:uncharacterized protein LOC135850027 isoform X1 n=1 Tax=Planococcus citri TaxID=170843 RepID=UPI0031FA4218
MSFSIPSVFVSQSTSKAPAEADQTATKLDHEGGDVAEKKTTNSDEYKQLVEEYSTMKLRQCATFYDDDVPCVVPVMIGTKIVGMELVTGSVPNITNYQAIDSIRQVAPDYVESIQLENALELQMATGANIKTDTTVAVIKMFFGSEILRVPFYIIETETAEPKFFMGTKSMIVHGINPWIRGSCATFQQSGKKAFLVPYVEPDQYADARSHFNVKVKHLETYTRDEIAQEMGIKRLICNTYYLI